MSWGRLAVANHRGTSVPRILWLPLSAGAVATGVLGTLAATTSSGDGGESRAALIATAACLVVTAAGLVDDLVPQRARGIRGHLRALAGGHLTTGLLKVVITAGAAVVTMAGFSDRSPTAKIAGIVLLAGAANLWNGLDVRPGRALKGYLVVAVAVGSAIVAGHLPWAEGAACAGVAFGALIALPFDLRERAMLGDAGANLLGFSAGLALVTVSPDPLVATWAVVVVALNAVAETITLSRAIDGVAPLRWFDRLGRLPDRRAPGTPT